MRLLGVCLASLALVACAAHGPDDRGVPDVTDPDTAAASTQAPRFIVLTPTARPDTSQYVSWRTARAYSGQTVEVREVGGGAALSFAATRKPATTVKNSGSASPQFTAAMTGLEPGTSYDYRIITKGGSSRAYRFRTAEATLGDPWHLLAFGDTQVDNDKQPDAIIAKGLARYPRARVMLHAGDVVNKPWIKTEWVELFSALAPARLTRNWIISIGNHEQCIIVKDCRSGNGEAFRSYFRWPRNGYPDQAGSWYYTDYQGVRVIALNSMGSRLPDQAKFLAAALADNPQPWSVVLMHAGPFASRGDRTNAGVRKYILPVLEKGGADLVLSGHDHSYARGYRSAGGPVYATSVSGPKFYTTSPADWKRNGATRVRAARGVATYQAIEVSAGKLVYRAVVAYKGKNASGSPGVGKTLDLVTIRSTN